MTTYPGHPAPLPAGASGKLPGRLGIWIGIAFVTIGVVLGLALVVGGFAGVIGGFDDVERVPIDGGGQVELAEGSADVYAERPEYAYGTSNSFDPNPDLTVRITGPSGQLVPVRGIGYSASYTINGKTAEQIGSIDVPEDGTYDVSVIRGEGSDGYTNVTIGNQVDVGGVVAIIAGVGVGGTLVLLGAILIIVFAVKRSNARKARAQGPGTGWPPAAPYPGAYPTPALPGLPPPPGGAHPGPWGAPPPPQQFVRPDGPAPAGWVPPPAAVDPPAGQPWDPPPSHPPSDQNGPIS